MNKVIFENDDAKVSSWQIQWKKPETPFKKSGIIFDMAKIIQTLQQELQELKAQLEVKDLIHSVDKINQESWAELVAENARLLDVINFLKNRIKAMTPQSPNDQIIKLCIEKHKLEKENQILKEQITYYKEQREYHEELIQHD